MSVGDATASGLSPSASPNTHAVLAALAPAGAMLLMAIALQVHFGALGEVSWLISVCEGWLDGKTPYVDKMRDQPARGDPALSARGMARPRVAGQGRNSLSPASASRRRSP